METLPSGLPKFVADTEDLARFLTSSSDFNSTMVKPAVFLPNPKDGKKSVFRHGKQPLDGLLQIGRENIPAERTLHGIAICKTGDIRAVRLDVVAQEPPLRHANIEWMIGDREMEKSQQKLIAVEIAQKAELIRL